MTAIIAVSFKSFSQSGINLTENTARMVVKELVTFDGLKVNHEILNRQIDALDEKVVTLEEVIANLKLQLENRVKVIENKDAQIKSYEQMTSELKSALKKERRTKRLYKIGSVIGAIAITAKLL